MSYDSHWDGDRGQRCLQSWDLQKEGRTMSFGMETVNQIHDAHAIWLGHKGAVFVGKGGRGWSKGRGRIGTTEKIRCFCFVWTGEPVEHINAIMIRSRVADR